MLSPLNRRLLLAPALLLLLTTAGCEHPSTPSSIARTERPKLPTRDLDLTASEHLRPLTGKTTGQLVVVDKGILDELYERLGEAIAAVTRGNNRAAGNKLQNRCAVAIFLTGKAPADCPKP